MKNIVLFLFVFSTLILAQENGKLSGRITDANNKEPLYGVNIIIKGTSLGAAAELNGSYFILNIPPGSYTVSASLVGYQTVTQEKVIILNGKTTKLDFALSESSVQLEGEVVITAKTPDIVKDKTSSSENIRTEDVLETPGIRSLEDVVALSPDVIDGHFRGGRDGEEMYNLQGMGIVNPLNSGVAFSPIVSAIEEVEVITSGFSAQYGNAQSGVVNISMKEGSSEKWSSYVETRNRVPEYKHWGSSVFNVAGNPYLQLLDSPDKWAGNDPLTDRKFYDFISYGFSSRYTDSVQAAAIAYELWRQAKKDLNRQYDDLWDKNIEFNISGPLNPKTRVFLAAQFENEWQEIPAYAPDKNRQLMGNIAYELGDGMSLKLSGVFQERSRERYSGLTSESGPTYYAGYRAWLWDRFFGAYTEYERNHQFGLRFAHALTHSTFYDIKISSLSTITKSGAKILDPNRYRDDLSDYGNWRYFNTPDLFRLGYTENDFIDEKTSTISLDATITSQVTQSHMLLGGIQGNIYSINVHNRTGLSSSVQALDEIYTANPFELSLFIQDKMEFEGMIANVGLRWDMYSQNMDYYVDQFSPIRNPNFDPLLPPIGNNRYYAPELAAKRKTPMVARLQPRIGISFPVFTNTVFHINYGAFLQRPAFERTVFSRVNKIDGSPIRLGNPLLKPQETKSYDIGVIQALGEGFTIDISGYSKDVSNLIERVYYIDEQQQFYESYANRDYADIRGFRIFIKKRQGALNGSIRYNYSVATGKSSNEFNASPVYREKPADGELSVTLPTPKDILLDFDRTHVFLLQLGGKSPKEFGPEVFGIYPFERFSVNFKSTIRSGRPYTYDDQGLGQLYNKRAPLEYNTDLKITRTFPKVWNFSPTIYLEVFNLFNNKIYAYNTVFNNPDNVRKYETDRNALQYYDEDVPFLADQTFLIYGNSPRSIVFGISANF